MTRIDSPDPATVARPRPRPDPDPRSRPADSNATARPEARGSARPDANAATDADGDHAAEPRRNGLHSRATRTVPTLLRELRDEAYGLIQQELLLVRSELRREVEEATSSLKTAVMGAVMLVVGLVILAIAASAGVQAGLLEAGMDPLIAGWLAPLIIAVVILIAGMVMVQQAGKLTSRDHWRPDRTEQSLRETREWAGRKI